MSENDFLTQKLKQKITNNDERSTQFARAERLKRVRNLANLSRVELCNDPNFMNLNTYKSWESARFGGLPPAAAKKVVERLAKVGVLCSVEWLLFEEGVPPSVSIACFNCENEDKKLSEKYLINQEVAYFYQLNNDAVHCEINDEAMLPHYTCGDIVAGIKFAGEDILSHIGKTCIVQLTNGDLFCRHLKAGQKKGLYALVCTNTEVSAEKLVQLDVSLNFVAPVIWHRKMK